MLPRKGSVTIHRGETRPNASASGTSELAASAMRARLAKCVRSVETRDTILDGVWGNEVVVTDRSVDRCVTTLRGKIELDGRNPVYIKTIRDIGYRFEPSEPVNTA